jgi:hypothetical protein
MARERLPNRRDSTTAPAWWPPERPRRIHVTAGFTDDGRVLEAFLRGGGVVGSERDHLLDDIAVLVSRDLQHGDGLAQLAAGVGRLPDGRPTSVVGAVIDALLELEQVEQQPFPSTTAESL